MRHPMKRNRRKLKARAAWWKAAKEDSAENMATRILTGQSLGEFLGKGQQAPVKGILG